jgi:hypothetical protein
VGASWKPRSNGCSPSPVRRICTFTSQQPAATRRGSIVREPRGVYAARRPSARCFFFERPCPTRRCDSFR